MTNATNFPRCAICGDQSWAFVYRGAVRDGAFGATREGEVARCGGCGVDRLAESLCLSDTDYRTGIYRNHLGQGHDLAKHYKSHDEFARFTTEVVWPRSLRGRVVADIGCGGGSLLDHLGALPAERLAIDPDTEFAQSLRARGYTWMPSAQAATASHTRRVDVAFAIQVIEHVENPAAFLAEIRPLLAPDGVLVLSTPNRDDILMDLLPDDFQAFFYRAQHRWYFDLSSLTRCAAAAGFAVIETRYVHRYGIANAMLWLRNRRPMGRVRVAPLDAHLDGLWRSWLEANGRPDNLYLVLQAS